MYVDVRRELMSVARELADTVIAKFKINFMANIEFDIDKVAKLSNLELSDEERAELSEQLPSIMAYVSKLHEVDTSGADPSAYLTKEKNVFREDEVIMDEDERARVIDNFPKKTGDALEVPAVFE